jgi:hypothetical protein
MKAFLFLLFVLGVKSGLFSQSVTFIEKNGTTYSDTTSTPAINVLTGELVRAKDFKRDTLQLKKNSSKIPNNHEDLMNRPHDYIIEPKKNQ